jgi:hypothetical protein
LRNGSDEASLRLGGPGRDFPILARDLIFGFFSQGGPRVRIHLPPARSQQRTLWLPGASHAGGTQSSNPLCSTRESRSPLSDLGRPRGVRKITPLAVACCGACASATAARNTPDRGCGGCNTRKGKKPALYAGSPRRCEQFLIRLPAGLAVDCGKEVVRAQLPDGGQARPPKGPGPLPPQQRLRAPARGEELEPLQRRWEQSIGPGTGSYNRPRGFPREKHFPSGNACAARLMICRTFGTRFGQTSRGWGR